MVARWAIIGMALWIVLALVFRSMGPETFTEGASGIVWLFLTVPLLTGAVTYMLLRTLHVARSDRSEAASVFATTGLMVSLFEISNFKSVFPNLPIAMLDQFAALFFACMAAVVFTGLVSSRVESI